MATTKSAPGKIERTRQKLVNAVRDEVNSSGDFNAELIAHRASISPATFYNHFATKDQALLAAYENVMDSLVDLLSQNPTYLIVAVVFSVIILFSLAKKLLKITLVVASFFILWIAYTVWTGQEISQEELKDKFLETGEKFKKNTIEKVQKKTEEELVKKIK